MTGDVLVWNGRVASVSKWPDRHEEDGHDAEEARDLLVRLTQRRPRFDRMAESGDQRNGYEPQLVLELGHELGDVLPGADGHDAHIAFPRSTAA